MALILTLQALASYYEFSPRLLGLMGCDPLKPALVVHEEHLNKGQALVRACKERMSIDRHSSDPEALELEEPSDYEKPPNLNHYRIVDEVWHFCSVDWGFKCKAPLNHQEPLAKPRQICALVTILSMIRNPK